MVLDVKSKIKGIGKSTTLIDASWDWGFDNADHPCALMDVRTSPTLDNHLTAFPFDPINYAAKVAITSKKRDMLIGNILSAAAQVHDWQRQATQALGKRTYTRCSRRFAVKESGCDATAQAVG